MSDIIKTYDPSNKHLSDKELSEMKDLTDEQIAELAKAYPNQPTGNAYLEYYNSNMKETEQNFSLGTWANLNALRKLGKKEFLPFRFRTNARRKVTAPIVAKQRTVDLSAKEVEGAEGLKSKPVVNDVKPVDVDASPELIEAEKELAQLIEDKAHHMTIKSAQAKVDELKLAKDVLSVFENQMRKENEEASDTIKKNVENKAKIKFDELKSAKSGE